VVLDEAKNVTERGLKGIERIADDLVAHRVLNQNHQFHHEDRAGVCEPNPIGICEFAFLLSA
jgi:hypothetical protein